MQERRCHEARGHPVLCDEVECIVGVELGLHDHCRAEQLMQRREQRDCAVISRAAHEMHVRVAELEDRYDLEDVFDVYTIGAPRPLRMSRRARRVDHRSAKGSDHRLAWLLVGRPPHQLLVSKPARRRPPAQRDEASIAQNFTPCCVDGAHVLGPCHHDSGT